MLLVAALTGTADRTRLTVSYVPGTVLPNTADVYGMRFQPIGVPEVTTPDATTAVKGRVELATNAEIDDETGTGSIVPTIGGLYRAIVRKAKAAGTTAAGIVKLAAATEARSGTDTSRAVTPAGLAALTPDANPLARGLVELATSGGAKAGVDTSRAVTAAEAKAAAQAFGAPIAVPLPFAGSTAPSS